MAVKWIVIISIALTVCGLLGFSSVNQYWQLLVWAIPYGLGAGSIEISWHLLYSKLIGIRVTYGLQYFKDLSYSFASFGSLIFGGLMLGRLIADFISHRLSDRKLIRIGLITEAIGILLVLIPLSQYYLAVIGFLIIGTGMGPIYPAIQHMAPANFGKKFAAAVIGLQMASAYIGSTFMPMIFGFIQQKTGIWIMPYYLAFFALLNFIFLETGIS